MSFPELNLTPTKTDCFSIDENSGKIHFQCTLDRELLSSASLQVIAKDSSSTELSATIPVEILIEDENDFSPVFSRPSYDFKVFENDLKGIYIGKVEAYDCDEGLNGQILYTIQPIKLHNTGFINEIRGSNSLPIEQYIRVSQEGDLYLKCEIDRESQENLEFQIVATDKGVFPKSSTALVRIQIQDRYRVDRSINLFSVI